jgi:3',5'-cyclic AMP phosphodiesterase CpdA
MMIRFTNNRLITLGMLWLAFILPADAINSANSDTLRFIHVTDIHACNLIGYHPFFIEKRQDFGNNFETFTDFLKSVPGKYQADIVIITGDNIDYYEAETEKRRVLDTQVEQYSRLLDQSNIPVYLTLGNHDIASYRVNPGPAVISSQLDAERARASWMRNITCFKEGTYYSHIFKIDTVTFRFIFLDNSYYSTEEITDGILRFTVDQYQLRWLDAQMKASPTDVEIIFMHQPLPYGEAVDNNNFIEPISVYSSKNKTYNLISVIEKNSSTRLIFAGHKHINSINRYILPNGDKLTQVLTGAFGNNILNWRVITITKDNVLISFPGNSTTEYIVPVR